jgi:membrane fusion protein
MLFGSDNFYYSFTLHEIKILSLFRKEALQAKKRDMFGDVIAQKTPRLDIAVYMLFFLFITLTTALHFIEHNSFSSAYGEFTTNKGLVTIRSPVSGGLENIHFYEGENVSVGDILFSVNTESSTHDGSSEQLNSILLIQREKENIKNRIASLDEDLNNKIARIKSDLTQKEFETDYNNKRLTLQKERVASHKIEFDSFSLLVENGYIDLPEYESKRQSLISAKIEIEDILLSISRLQQETRRLKLDLLILKEKHKQTKLELEDKLLSIKQRESKSNSELSEFVKSPVDGVVASFTNPTLGRTVSSDEKLLSIIPTGSIYIAEIFIPSESINDVKVGDGVKLEVIGLASNRYGTVDGLISHLAKQSVTGPVSSTLTIDKPSYRAVVKINSVPEEIHIRTGMTVKGKVVGEKQSLLSWIFGALVRNVT